MTSRCLADIHGRRPSDITSVHPDVACLAPAPPLDGRPLSLILHGLTLIPESVFGNWRKKHGCAAVDWRCPREKSPMSRDLRVLHTI